MSATSPHKTIHIYGQSFSRADGPNLEPLGTEVGGWDLDVGSAGAKKWQPLFVHAGRLRRRLAVEGPRCVSVYHDGCGMEWLGVKDGAERRVLRISTVLPFFDAVVEAGIRYADLVVASSEGIHSRLRERFPYIPDRLISTIPEPLVVRRATESEPRPQRTRIGVLVFGQTGRESLRRIAALVESLRDLAGAEVRVVGEAAGDSLGASWVGRLSGEMLWEEMETWRYAAFVQDVLGPGKTPLEALAAGAIPIIPALGLAQPLLGDLGVDYCYETSEPESAAARIRELDSRWEAVWPVFAGRRARLLDRHKPEVVAQQWETAISKSLEGRKIRTRRRPGFPMWIPFAIYRAMYRLRAFGRVRP